MFEKAAVAIVLLLMCGSLVLIVVSSSRTDPNRPSPTPDIADRTTADTFPASRTVTVESYCGESEDKVSELYSVIASGDMAAAAGLVTRGAAFRLVKGTRVTPATQDGKLSHVTVESGFEYGKDCWIPTALLR